MSHDGQLLRSTATAFSRSFNTADLLDTALPDFVSMYFLLRTPHDNALVTTLMS